MRVRHQRILCGISKVSVDTVSLPSTVPASRITWVTLPLDASSSCSRGKNKRPSSSTMLCVTRLRNSQGHHLSLSQIMYSLHQTQVCVSTDKAQWPRFCNVLMHPVSRILSACRNKINEQGSRLSYIFFLTISMHPPSNSGAFLAQGSPGLPR